MLTNIKILYMYFLKSAFFIFKFIMTLLPYQHKYSCRLILTPAWHSICPNQESADNNGPWVKSGSLPVFLNK